MKVVLLATGKTDFKFVNEGNELYLKRIKHYVNFEFLSTKDIKKNKDFDSEQLRKQEGALILNYVEPGDFLVLLDEKGKEFSSVEFSDFINHKMNLGLKKLIFVIGGAYGFADEVYKRANEKISLSRMTFSHQIVRVIFLEQLYRACTILKGEPYHH